MKRMFLFFSLLLAVLSASAQTDTLRQELNYLFGNLSPSAVPSGYLAPYGMDMVQRQRFNGILTDSNVINDMDLLRLLYADVYTARFSSSAPTLIPLDSLNSRLGKESNKLAIFYGQLSDISEDALTNNQVTYSSGQLFDVTNRGSSPYQDNKAIKGR